jgi:hypothetical protein
MNHAWRYTLKALAVASLLFCALMLPAQTGKSGITGVVIQVGHPGPTRIGEPQRYYSGPLEVIRITDHQRVAMTHSDKNGSFTVTLPPGRYFITQSNPSLSRIHSEEISVEKDRMTAVKIYADNGMR